MASSRTVPAGSTSPPLQQVTSGQIGLLWAGWAACRGRRCCSSCAARAVCRLPLSWLPTSNPHAVAPLLSLQALSREAVRVLVKYLPRAYKCVAGGWGEGLPVLLAISSWAFRVHISSRHAQGLLLHVSQLLQCVRASASFIR